MGLTRRGRCTHGTDTHPLGVSSNHRTQTNRMPTNDERFLQSLGLIACLVRPTTTLDITDT